MQKDRLRMRGFEIALGAALVSVCNTGAKPTES